MSHTAQNYIAKWCYLGERRAKVTRKELYGLRGLLVPADGQAKSWLPKAAESHSGKGSVRWAHRVVFATAQQYELISVDCSNQLDPIWSWRWHENDLASYSRVVDKEGRIHHRNAINEPAREWSRKNRISAHTMHMSSIENMQMGVGANGGP